VAHLVSLTCPDCRGSQQVDAAATSTRCVNCDKTITSIFCDVCDHHFSTVKRRNFQCPRCLNTMRSSAGHIAPFEAIAEQRLVAAPEVDTEILAAKAPGLYSQPSRFSRRSKAVAVAAVLVVALVVIAIAAKGSPKKATPPASATSASTSTSCQPGVVNTPTLYRSTQDAHGDYHVAAAGQVTNHSSVTLHHVVLEWVVTYADLTTSVPTKVAIAGGTIPTGGTVTWTAAASTNDGQVPPTGVRVTEVTTPTFPNPLCGTAH
jgi:hypothetical protein